jgi:preprotein translocase subunit Sss1
MRLLRNLGALGGIHPAGAVPLRTARGRTIGLFLVCQRADTCGNELSKFVEMLRIARKCRRIIFQEFTDTLIVDAVGIFSVAIGFLGEETSFQNKPKLYFCKRVRY